MNTPFSELVAALRNVPIRRIITALERDGFAQRRNTIGAHRYYDHPDGRQVVISFHKRGDTLTRRTLRDVLQNTEWNAEDAVRLKLLKRPP